MLTFGSLPHFQIAKVPEADVGTLRAKVRRLELLLLPAELLGLLEERVEVGLDILHFARLVTSHLLAARFKFVLRRRQRLLKHRVGLATCH